MAEANKSLLVLRLEGALQSWGENSKWDFRDSAKMPSKSGVIGLLSCAMGLSRNDPEILALSRTVRIAVRADRPGVMMTDYQTVTAERMLNAEGKPRGGGNTILTPRCYLQDACFTVILAMPESWKERVVAALKAPKWMLYLGRKNCVPSRPVLECENPSEQDMSSLIKTYPLAKGASYPIAYECDQQNDALSSYSRTDERVAAERGFAKRMVWRGMIREEV